MWRAVVALPDLSPETLSRVSRTPLAHAWGRWRGAPAPVFSSRRPSPLDVLALAELLADLDAEALRRWQSAPLYDLGLPAGMDRGSVESWLSAPAAAASGRPLDCKVLAPWRAAELRLAGEPAALVVDVRADPATGEARHHLLVRRAGAGVEDPQAEVLARARGACCAGCAREDDRTR